MSLLPTFSFRSAAWRGAGIGIACAVVCWCLNATPLFRALENWAFDGCFEFRGRRPCAADVVIVAVDEASLAEMQKPLMFFSPELAKVVTYLKKQGAASIGVDFLLPRSEKTMDFLLPGQVGAAETMGQAVGLAGNVVLPEWFLDRDRPLTPPFEWYDAHMPSTMPWADLGFVDFTVDSDSCLRRQLLRQEDAEGLHPCMASALVAKARRLSREWFSAEHLMIDGVPIPLDEEGCLPINYVGPAGSIRKVSFREVLAAAGKATDAAGASSALYKDAVVLIGTEAGTFQDRYPTPYTYPPFWRWFSVEKTQMDRQMPGVEVHANVVATLLDRAFINRPWFLATPLMLFVVGGVLGALLARCSLEMGVVLTFVHHIVWRGLAVGAFCWGNWHLEAAAMLVLGVLLYGTVFAMRWRWIRRMMGMVKSEAVARALEAGGAKLDLRGQQRDITVLFCDIRNFTPFSEQHSPHDVVSLLNAFFAETVPVFEADGGTVNQYIGDAVMVIFGAPRPQADHAARAVRAAVEVVRRVHLQDDRWKELGAAEFKIGIGIHSGRAVVGTVGSPRRLDYTAIGDTVNTAARLESANKELQSEVVVSQATFSLLPEEERQKIAAQSELQTVLVKGKQKALQVYAIR